MDRPPTLTATLEPSAQPRSSLRGKLIILLLFATAMGAFFYFDLKHYLSLQALKENRDHLLEFTQLHYVAAVALYIGIYIVQTAFSLPGGAIMTLAGGFLFGTLLGLLYVNVAATTGATLAFLGARYLFRDWVERRFGSRLEAIQEGFSKNALSYLITLRLIPLFPFFLVNVVSGLTRVSLGTYALATSIGIIPGSLVFAYAGRQLGSIGSLRDVASPPVLLAFTLLGLLALVPVLYRKLTSTS